MGEAFAVGLLGWLLGLGVGILTARALRVVVAGFGVAVTDSGLLVTGRTVAITLAVGVGVTPSGDLVDVLGRPGGGRLRRHRERFAEPGVHDVEQCAEEVASLVLGHRRDP